MDVSRRSNDMHISVFCNFIHNTHNVRGIFEIIVIIEHHETTRSEKLHGVLVV